MAGTHSDGDQWFESLKQKADQMLKNGKSQITAGRPDEAVIAHWSRDKVSVTQLPDDEHGILRVSIGGGQDLPFECNYLTFRGDYDKCVDLLRKALSALEGGPL